MDRLPAPLPIAAGEGGSRRRRRATDVREPPYRAIFESSLDGLFLWDETPRLVDVNPAGLALYGYRRDEMVGRTYPPGMPSQYVRSRLQMVRRALQGIPTHVETTVLRPDGSTFEADLRVLPFVHQARPHALAVLRDITERRQREQALRDSEAQYRAIFNASIDALVLRDAQFRIVDVNATYEALTGFSRAEVLGADQVMANPPAIVSRIRAMHEQALAGSTPRLQTHLLRRDGGHYELELRAVPIQHRGKPHVLYMGRDVTQARQAEKALRGSEEQYRAIFNASADALVLRDADYRAVEVNPAYAVLSGSTCEEVLRVPETPSPSGTALGARHLAEHQLALGGQPLSFQTTARRMDGTPLEVEVRATPMTYRGQPHVLYASRDISDRIAAEQRRGDLERELRQAQKMQAIGQLTGGLAHDFNNILTSVLGYVMLAQEGPAASADATLASQLAQARLAAERARDHVAQLLAFSRPHRGERRRLVPGQVALEVVQLLRPNLPSTIVLDCGSCADVQLDLPHVLVDPVQFEQVLLNLLLNARDAIDGHGTIQMDVGCAPASGPCASCGCSLGPVDWVGFEIRDDGHGIAGDVLDRMFDPFFTTKPVGRGTGMGLAMVHGIVHDHGGHLQVQSAPGHGSTFRVLLPRAPRIACLDSPLPVRAPTAAPPGPLHGRVLLVEDEATVSAFMQDLLGGWGLDVVAEHDPALAARRLERRDEPLALLLTDHTMPGMTGLALARHAHQHRPALPVLLYTGNAAELDPAELAGGGISAVLAKPLDVAALRGTVAGLLGAAPPVCTGPQ
ncbi:hybrid sensor histidine kinase/response regulator [Ramlibacter algicola]|uniref:histidine kinase n=1 Tax=Ramlibacter algicola TaxID=2795217 RepID=A0A934Q139_9BURK|nr:PAS domain-containing sensor histidine kinase [Ramlibacter algicola]MBK0392823.1 PAS domain S-box protein [Ramlibacter algicola]